ncbi:MAG TPA: universal stress protein [Candidatus Acidoferrales bacterium]|nr:universal stress protein [Candidatus Acidoferrales bacterium]
MYTKMLIPLDESRVAEQVLPYARCLAKALAMPVELLEVIDPEALNVLARPEEGRYIDTLVDEKTQTSKSYLQTIAQSFEGVHVNCLVENGKAEERVIERAAADKNTLIVMATHGRSGIQRWMLGSVADKVLHGATNHLLLVRARESGTVSGLAALTSVVAPLDGSSLAEQVLPHVVELAKRLKAKLVLMRAYALPPAVTADEYGTYMEELVKNLESETLDYLAQKIKEVQSMGLANVEPVASFGYGAEEIIKLGRQTPDNLIAMCTHGRSGVKRWVLGSVTERVVQHSGDPVLIIRAA